MVNQTKQLLQFLQKDIWSLPDTHGSRLKSFSIKQLKIILLAIYKFDQTHSRLQAASMTYYSVLALVPTLTLIYGLMKGFGLEETLKTELYRHLSSHREFIDALFNMAQSYVADMHGTVFAGIGLTLLLWSVFKTLNTIESAFNDIWGIKESKPVLRKLSDYLSVFLICPLLIILSGSVTVYVSTEINYIRETFFFLGPFVPLVYVFLFFMPFIVICMVFSFMYIFMPNTQVNFSAGIWGGFIAGTLFQIAQWSYILFQVWIGRMNTIYGSLAAIPLFLAWLQISWMIVLFGAEVAFARQYLKTYEFEPKDHDPSPHAQKLAALMIMYASVKNFEQGLGPCTVPKVSEHLHLPARFTQNIASDLVHAGLLSQVHIDESKIFAFQPARTIDDISVKDVLDVFEYRGQENTITQESKESKIVLNHLERISEKIAKAEGSILLKDL